MEDKPILLVEDNIDDVDLALRAFKRNHIANPIVVKNDGVEALEWLEDAVARSSDQKKYLPTVVLLDIKMPRMDGIELLGKIRKSEALRLLPVVMLTSSKHDRDILESYNLGVNSYICKPVDFEQFNQAIQTIGLYWLVLNESPYK